MVAGRWNGTSSRARSRTSNAIRWRSELSPFRQFNRGARAQRKPAAAGRHDLDVRALLAQALAQQDQAALEVRFDRRQAEPGVQPQFTIRELAAAGALRFAQDLPQDPRRHVADQVL